jgi:uncharacterized protein YqhQ
MGKAKISMGGQALIEGVMIKSGRNIAMTARKEDGTIVRNSKKLRKIKFKWMQWPFIRGIVNLIEMLVIGMQGLIWSANQAAEEGEEEVFSVGELIMVIGMSMGFVILFFVALPYFMTDLFGVKEAVSPLMFNLVDGIIKMILFIGYIIAISFMKDVKRLFQYHGAEHRAVYCYEAKLPLTVKNCNKFPTMHPRCGTAFIMLVFIVSIFVLSLIPGIMFGLFPALVNINVWLQKLILFPVRVSFIPLIAGISYELLRVSGKYSNNFFMKIFILPGIGMQLLTTKNPDSAQQEVAIAAVKLAEKIGK